LGASLRIREHLVSALEREECLGTPRYRVIRVKSGSHHSINTMNGLDVGLAADLQDFVIIAIRFHVIQHALPWRKVVSPSGTCAVLHVLWYLLCVPGGTSWRDYPGHAKSQASEERAVHSASAPTRRGAALGRGAQAFGKRPAEGYGHGEVEAAADHRQAKLFALRRGDADAASQLTHLPGS
jgi:hypothetical protein